MHRRKQRLKIRINVTWMWISIYSTTSFSSEIYFFPQSCNIRHHSETESNKTVQTVSQSKTNTLFLFTAQPLIEVTKEIKHDKNVKTKHSPLRPLVPVSEGEGWAQYRGAGGAARDTSVVKVDDLVIIFHYHTPSLSSQPAARKAASQGDWLTSN